MMSAQYAAMVEMTEKVWQTSVLQLATTLGWRWFHPFNSRRSPHGYPDLTLVRDRVLFVELKRETGKTTAAQDAWLEALQAAGAEVYVWRPSDLPAVAAALTRREKRAAA